jgi:hypothetical protein
MKISNFFQSSDDIDSDDIDSYQCRHLPFAE